MAYSYTKSALILILMPQFPTREGCQRPPTGKVCARVLGSIVVEEAGI